VALYVPLHMESSLMIDPSLMALLFQSTWKLCVHAFSGSGLAKAGDSLPTRASCNDASKDVICHVKQVRRLTRCHSLSADHD
jgi:hypothetical protein